MLARQLRELREQSGVSAEFARKAIGVGKQTLWRMETGQPVRLNPLFIARLCEVYGAREELSRKLLALTAETFRNGWWHAYSDAMPKHFDLFVGLEEAAQRAISYQTVLVPGILQTAGYRRALIWVDHPTMPAADVERRIELLTRRKSRLSCTESPLALEAVLDEAALRRAIGGRGVITEQLKHLSEVGALPNISVRVIPLAAQAYSGLTIGPFDMLEFPQHPTTHLMEPPVIYLQGKTDAQYLEKADEIQEYQNAYTDLQRSALDESDSRALIQQIVTEYEW
ncbi:helix-turn-helix domain-containing protein [Nocardia altamirensis]|uniref:helix-turn-helix domain-containing protein n=1 Tax=Nocardia altamirensis TaxID=472158 RepID=UPI00084024D7|nr:helix-turn-helix transcriptional regulator [Nocardia altamirensis]